MAAIVRVRGVVKEFGEGATLVKALRGIDLDIEAGAFEAIAGPSGSGKTTLLNIISGLDTPSRGQVFVDDQEVTGLSARALSRLRLCRIGFVFQAYNLMPVLTAFENAEYVLLMQGVGKAERRHRVMEVLGQVGLHGMEKRFPRELSGGQQQRVAIARAIVAEPALVLADEPTANVDSQTAAGLLDLMAELNEKKGVTFVFSSHDANVLKRAKRLIILKDGALDRNGHAPHEK